MRWKKPTILRKVDGWIDEEGKIIKEPREEGKKIKKRHVLFSHPLLEVILEGKSPSNYRRHWLYCFLKEAGQEDAIDLVRRGEYSTRLLSTPPSLDPKSSLEVALHTLALGRPPYIRNTYRDKVLPTGEWTIGAYVPPPYRYFVREGKLIRPFPYDEAIVTAEVIQATRQILEGLGEEKGEKMKKVIEWEEWVGILERWRKLAEALARLGDQKAQSFLSISF
ncbi:MAG: hypothetical protein GXN92_00270 [Candidatus Micrarchaeota archaeon]|nr:hypothetical protein [Candidatus Micrarchaeota archaeon]